MRKAKISILFIIFVALYITIFAQTQDLKLHFIDVGEGESILIETNDGETALIDTGNLITGYRVVEYLKKKNILHLDYLIFTHSHFDHIGGAFFVLQMIDVKKIYDNGVGLAQAGESSDIYRWYEGLVRYNENYGVLKAKDILSLGKVSLKVLWPDQPFILSDLNDNSLVIMVEYGKFRCLLTGDLTTVAEKELFKQGIDLKANILKAGHHGADDASSEEFLKVVAPQSAIISVNKNNIRGYPSQNVLKRLQNLEILIYRTDKNADILLSAGYDGQFRIDTER